MQTHQNAQPDTVVQHLQLAQRATDFMQCASEGVVFYTETKILDCNQAFEKLLGHTRDSLLGQPPLRLFPASEQQAALRHMYLGRGMPINAKMLHASGKTLDVEVTGRSATYAGQACWVATLRDTQTQVYITESLVRSQARYRALVENADQAIIFVQDRLLAYANPAASQFFKLRPSDLHTKESMHMIHPDDRELALRRRKEMIAGDPDRSVLLRTLSPPTEHLHSDSVVSYVRFYGSVVEWEGRAATLIFITDLTAQFEKQESLHSALMQEKELGDLKTRFVSMASHEFRTPLSTIQTSSELLQHYSERLSSTEKAEAITDIQLAVQRMQAMMENFLAFGRMSSNVMHCKPVSLALVPLVRSMVHEALVADSHQHVVDVRLRAPMQEDTHLLLDPLLLRQMLGNLLSNACKYSHFGDPIDLLIEAVSAQPSAGRAGQQQLRVVITDRGMGIPQRDMPLLFSSFHRASNATNVPGSGLGLAIVDRAVRAHGGSISVQSTEGEGAAFELLLPWKPA